MARLHRGAYSRDHFLALLPARVLVDYYARFLGRGSCVLVAVHGGASGAEASAREVLGFAVFGRDIEGRIAAFKRERRWSIAWVALQHPVLSIGKVFAALGARRSRERPHVAAPTLLLSIAVGAAGKGVGRALLEEMLRRSAAAGEKIIGLYVRHRNVAAINAYLRVGFRIIETLGDQYYMEWALDPDASTRYVPRE